MKITIINTSDRTGGAAIAAYRLFSALLERGIDVWMLVNEKTVDHDRIVSVNRGWISRKKAFFRFALERLFYLFFERDRSVRFAFSPGFPGKDISRHPLVRDADLLHLHWINFGFLSTRGLSTLLATGKPVVWTFHDMWAFTGGCHYSLQCDRFRHGCGKCPYLKRPSEKDLSRRCFGVKEKIFGQAGFTIITCSAWLKGEVERSRLMERFTVHHVPNLVDLELFRPMVRKRSREQLGIPAGDKLVLFGAMNIADTRKGFLFFRKALDILVKQGIVPVILLYGKSNPSIIEGIPCQVRDMGTIGSESRMAQIYNAADLFVIPSVQDNLPNTIVEAHACGIPVVGFDTAGISEMIDHKLNGYLARPFDAEDLASGIAWLLHEADPEEVSRYARRKAEQTYQPGNIVQKHVALYQSVIEKENG